MAVPIDVAPRRAATLPHTGLGRGWEVSALLGLTLLLLSFGLVTLYSASAILAQREGLPDYHFVVNQALGAALGLGALALCARIPYPWWGRMAWPLVLVSWVLLMICILPGTEAIAPEIKGARRWVDLGVTFQPSEVAKVAMIIWTAHLAVKKQEHFRSLRRGLLPFMLIWVALLVPVALEPDLSTAILIGMLGAIVVFAAGGRIGHFVFLGLLVSPFLLKALGVGFRADRISSFLDPAADPSGAGFQVHQSLIAIGSGGVTGVGFGEGRQKFGFLPEPHNDFIFGMIGEEWGLVGVLLTVAIYTGIVLVGFRVARRTPELFGQLLAAGFTSLIALHALLHMAVGLGLVPTTGLSLPLVSYGRSNLIVTLAAVGIIMAVAREEGRGRVRRA